MNSKGYAAILVAIIVIVAGVGAYVITSDSGSSEEKISKKYVEYDATKGWGSWDPILTNTHSSCMTGSAYIAQVAEYWYKTIYGEDPDYSRYTVDDVPDDFLKYDHLVTRNSDGTFTISSMVRDDAEYVPKTMTVSANPDYIICAGSFSTTVYSVLCEAMGKEFADYDPDVLKAFYSKIYAGDSGFITNLSTLYGIPSTDDKTSLKMSSCTNIMKYKEQYMEVFGDIKDSGKNVAFFGMASVGSEAFDWMNEQMSVFDSYALGFNVADLPAIMSGIEVIANVLGYGDTAQDIVDNIRLKLYTISQEAKENEEKYDYTRSALYINVDANKARGTDTLANELMELFGFQNVATHSGNQEIKEEQVIVNQPDIIIFVSELSPSDPNFDLKTALRVKDA